MRAPLFALLLAACGGTTSGPGPLPPVNPPTGCEKDADCGPNRHCDMAGTNYQCADGAPIVVPNFVLGPAPGCTSGRGYELIAGKAYACPGTFTDSPKSRCAQGYIWCTSSMGVRQLTTGLQHFFASAQPIEAEETGLEAIQCGWQQANTVPHYVGGIGGAAKAYVKPIPTPCAGWPKIVQCNLQSGGPWSCSLSMPSRQADIDHLRNDSPDDGVICCTPPIF